MQNLREFHHWQVQTRNVSPSVAFENTARVDVLYKAGRLERGVAELARSIETAPEEWRNAEQVLGALRLFGEFANA